MSELVKKLKEAHLKEVESLYNYHVLGHWLGGFDGGDVSEELLGDVGEELNHADKLAERLKVHGVPLDKSTEAAGGFNQDFFEVPQNPTEVKEVVKGVIEAEKDAVKTYKELYEEAEEAGDIVTMRLAQELLEDEEKHLRDFEDFLAELKSED